MGLHDRASRGGRRRPPPAAPGRRGAARLGARGRGGGRRSRGLGQARARTRCTLGHALARSTRRAAAAHRRRSLHRGDSRDPAQERRRRQGLAAPGPRRTTPLDLFARSSTPMSSDDVHTNEMNDPHDFDDNATDALLSGGGRDVDPRLADLLSDMRTAYTSTPPAIGLELSALLEGTRSTPARSFLSRRFEQMRASMLAKIGVGAVAAVAATGGLAAAGALPSRVKDAVSHLGI